MPWVFVRRLKGAWLWVKAADLCSKHKFEEALRAARAMPDDMKTDLDWRVFEIQQLYFLNWNMECIDRANSLLGKHANDTKQSQNRRYLLRYVRRCALDAFGRIADGSPIPSLFATSAAEELQQELVDERFKRWFPMDGEK